MKPLVLTIFALMSVAASPATAPGKPVSTLPLKLGFYMEEGGRCDRDSSPKLWVELDKTGYFEVDAGSNFVSITQLDAKTFRIKTVTESEGGKKSYGWEIWSVDSPTSFRMTAMGDEGNPKPWKDFTPASFKWCAAKSPRWVSG